MRIFTSIIILFFISSIISCKKNNPSPPSYGTITANINDTPYIFNYQDYLYSLVTDSLLQNLNSPNAIGININGFSKSSNIDSGFIMITLDNNTTPISSKTYSSYITLRDTSFAIIKIILPNNKGIYTSLNNGIPFTVIVDSVTNNTIKGTFSGTAYNNSDTTKTIVVTNGIFSLNTK